MTTRLDNYPQLKELAIQLQSEFAITTNWTGQHHAQTLESKLIKPYLGLQFSAGTYDHGIIISFKILQAKKYPQKYGESLLEILHSRNFTKLLTSNYQSLTGSNSLIRRFESNNHKSIHFEIMKSNGQKAKALANLINAAKQTAIEFDLEEIIEIITGE